MHEIGLTCWSQDVPVRAVSVTSASQERSTHLSKRLTSNGLHVSKLDRLINCTKFSGYQGSVLRTAQSTGILDLPAWLKLFPAFESA